VADPGTHKVVDAVACGLEFWLHSDGVERGQGLGEGTHHPTLLGFGWLDPSPPRSARVLLRELRARESVGEWV
jgi:hypothetical protein